VAEFDRETGAGRVLLDDGSALPFDPPAFAAGGLRFLRPGQRVKLERADDGTIRRVTLATFA
jgi:2-phospho-L-lactate guanylyltransferase